MREQMKLHPYYIERERKNEEFVEACFWASVIGIGITILYLAAKCVICHGAGK